MITNETDLRHIWQQVFHDKNEFLDLFFLKKKYDDHPLSLIEDGKIISALHLLPYTFSMKKAQLKGIYTYAAATLPGYRGQGKMGTLIKHSFDMAQKQEGTISVLLPAEQSLYDYYSSFGYASVFFQGCQTFQNHEILCEGENAHISFSSDFNKIYASYQMLKNEAGSIIVQHEDAFHFVLEMNALFGGHVHAILKNDVVVGHMIYQEKDENLTAQEFYCKEEEQTTVLSALAQYFDHCKEFSLCGLPGRFQNKKPAGMMRILDARAVLSAFSSVNPHYDFKIALKDELILKNNGIFHVKDGRVLETNGIPAFSMNISKLPLLLFFRLENSLPYMNLMMN